MQHVGQCAVPFNVHLREVAKAPTPLRLGPVAQVSLPSRKREGKYAVFPPSRLREGLGVGFSSHATASSRLGSLVASSRRRSIALMRGAAVIFSPSRSVT